MSKAISVSGNPAGDLFILRIENPRPDDATVEVDSIDSPSLLEKYTFVLTRDEMEKLTRESLSAITPRIQRKV